MIKKYKGLFGEINIFSINQQYFFDKKGEAELRPPLFEAYKELEHALHLIVDVFSAET